MSCINPKQPIFQKILSKTNNPLGAEILYDRLMDILKDDIQYNKYADNLSEDIAKDIMLESPALKREADNVYSIHLVKDSNKILTLEQAYKVAEERTSKINKLYAVGLKPIARFSTEKGDVRIFIEPNKQHMSDYIINEMIKEEKDKDDYYSGYANVQTPNVNFNLKVVNNINNNLSKVNQWYKQLGNTDKFWDKLQKDLQIPKEQIMLLRQSEGNTIEEKLTSFIANYSYTIEINTAKTPKVGEKFLDREYGYELEVTEETLQNQINDGFVDNNLNTQYYSNLTVPGGTNYTENEISTPLITPAIKGHAAFSTDSGIGWFRADDKQTYNEQDIDTLINNMKNSGILKINCS